MKTVSFMLALILSFSLYAEESGDEDRENFVCSQETTLNDPPFFISQEYRQGDRIWENFRDLDNSNRSSRYIPRGAIVYTPKELYDRSDAPDYRVPVEVLSLPSRDHEEEVQKSRARRSHSIRAMGDVRGKDRVVTGDQGWLDKRSLRSAGDYVFVLKEDSQIHNLPGAFRAAEDGLLKLKTEGDEFVAKRCCTPDSADVEKKCFDKYKMEIQNQQGETVSEVYSTLGGECSVFQDITPIHEDLIGPFQEIYSSLVRDKADLHMEDLHVLPKFNYWRGSQLFVEREEMVKMPIDKTTNLGPFGSYHYKPDDEVSSDAYMKPKSLCAFTKILQHWQDSCEGEGCQVQFGDMYHHDSWGVHAGHDSGECVDIRPLRKNDDLNHGLTYRNRRYDGEKTGEFIELLQKSGARTIIFNDRELSGEGASHDGGRVHNDHIHVCFGEDRDRVHKTCEDGVSP